MPKMHKLINNSSLGSMIIKELKYHSKSYKNIFSKIKKNCNFQISPLLKSISINSYRCNKPNISIISKEIVPSIMKFQNRINKKPLFPKLFSPIINSTINNTKSVSDKRKEIAINQSKQIQCLPTLLNKYKAIINKEPLIQFQCLNNNQASIKQSFKPKSYSFYTQSGGKHNKLKLNQDAYMINNPIEIKDYTYCGVFDGHGKYGSLISQNVALFFQQYYCLPEFIKNSMTSSEIIKELTQNNFENIRESHRKAELLIKENEIDGSLSGTSATLLFFIDDILICSNVGDSRAIAITLSNTVIPLSYDHKPELANEAQRIRSLKGRVERFKGDSSGPLRIWLKDEDYPGLSMSRSIGDFIAEEVGVINEPEVIRYSLKEMKPKIIICATDGIWELLSYDEIISILEPFYILNDAEGAVKQLTEEATLQWKKINNGFVDDITVILFFI